jgi:hypothetical protein
LFDDDDDRNNFHPRSLSLSIKTSGYTNRKLNYFFDKLTSYQQKLIIGHARGTDAKA